MKLKKSWLLLLLIPFALAFMSCNNEIPEELIIEFIPYSGEGGYTIDDVDYLELKLYKEPDGGDGENNQVTNILPVFKGNLYRGEVLRLGDLEPGRYTLSGTARKKTGGESDCIVGYVDGVGDKVVTENCGTAERPVYRDFIIVDEFSPTMVKLIVSLTSNSGD